MSQRDVVQKYLKLVETFDLDATRAAEILHEDYQQWELPNLLNPKGQKSDAADSFRRMAMGKTILASQCYEVSKTVEQGNTVVVEAIWTGVMALDAGPLKKGATLKAYFCMFFELEGGKIRRVRNYDCFEPFAG